MSKTTPEEAAELARKHGIHYLPSPAYKARLAALIDEVRGVDAEPVAWAQPLELSFVSGNYARSVQLNCEMDEYHGFTAPLYTRPAPSQPAAHPLDALLPEICQLIDTCKADFERQGCWSEWDQSVRDRITAYNLDRISATPPQPALTVWFGSMPESNGKKNWTVLLRRKTPSHSLSSLDSGICFGRSEYHDRERYHADCLRFVIGELPEPPHILDYDSELKDPKGAA